jgi:hypothetical protein
MSDDIGGAVILEQDQGLETSRESPMFSASKQENYRDEVSPLLYSRPQHAATAMNEMRPINNHSLHTHDAREHSVREGIHIFNTNMDQSEEASIDGHKRGHSAPRSILSKKSRDHSKSKELSQTASTQKLDRLSNLPSAIQPVSTNEMVSPARNVLFSQENSNLKSASAKSAIEELMPEERYRNGERIG